MREWVTNLKTTHYCVGSAIGPHPFPTIVRDFQRVIGREIKQQMAERIGKLPDAVIACVGGGSNAIGTFYDFIEEKNVRLIGVEAGGDGEFRSPVWSFRSLAHPRFNPLPRCRDGPSFRHVGSRKARCLARRQDVPLAIAFRSDHGDPLDLGRSRLPREYRIDAGGCIAPY